MGVRGVVSRWWIVFTEIRGTAGSSILIIAVSFAASLLAARLLGPEHRGVLAAAVVYASLAAAIGDAGLNQAVPYFAARHRLQAPAVLGTAAALALGLGGSAALAAGVMVRVSDGIAAHTWIYLLSVPFSMLTTHLAGYMSGGGMLTQFNMMRTLQSALLLVALLAASAIRRPDVSTVLVIAVCLSIGLALFAVLTVARTVPLAQWRADRAVGRSLLGYAGQSYIGNIFWLLNSRLDQLMMSFLLSAAVLGIYATSVAYAGVVFSFFGAFAMLAFAKASSLEAHEHDKVDDVIRHYSRVAMVLGLPSAAVLILAAPWLFPLLFGAAFTAGVVPAMVLCGGGAILGFNYILSNGLRIRNRPLLPSIAEGVGVVVSLAGLAWALPRFGMLGAAVVSLASYAAVLLMLLYFTRSHAAAAIPPHSVAGRTS